MTRKNFTSINVVLDKSGSMGTLAKDTMGSFNTFLKEQKEVEGEAVFTLCTFNHDLSVVHDFVKLASVEDLDAKTYSPVGNTALLDALGYTIDSVGKKLEAMPEDDRPSKVIFLVITDGEENSSRRYTKEKIKSMVEHQRETYKWEFVFVGANVDAFRDGQSYGFSGSNSVSYNATKGGTHKLYESVSSNLRSYRISDAAAAASGNVDFFGQTGQTPTGQTSVTTTTTTTTTNPDLAAVTNPTKTVKK